MENAKIDYKIKINVGKYKDEIIVFTTTIEELEDNGLVGLLIEHNYLYSWCNNNEYTIISREIIIL